MNQRYHVEEAKAYKEEYGTKRIRRKDHTDGLKISQERFEAVLINLIVDGMLPLSFVALRAFIQYTHGNIYIIFIMLIVLFRLVILFFFLEISTGVSEPSENIPRFNIVSQHTLKSIISNKFDDHKTDLINLLANTEYVCCTADIWSTKHKSYLGVTVHWIEKDSLDRQSKLLCCRRFMSPHDHVRIAEMLSDIYKEFRITHKVFATVTDNASNFSAAFKKYGISLKDFEMLKNSVEVDNFNDLFTSVSETLSNCEDDDGDESNSIHQSESNEVEIEFVEIDDNMLPSHFRCASHTLSLLATKDALKALNDAKYSKHSNSAFLKVIALSKKNNKPKSSEIIQRMLGASIPTPCVTRYYLFV